MTVSIPCDFVGNFDPELVAKYQRHFPGLDYKITLMRGGMTPQEISVNLEGFIGSTVTVAAWKNFVREAALKWGGNSMPAKSAA
ncbi:transposase [Methylocella silvestris]|uniref:transposase n=1 Tax=Methylocella silvestris TaxID=199596 RepID=UPI00017237CB|nr:transposase [Methylocella silvestris]